MANLESGCREVVDWLQVAPVRSTPGALSLLLTLEPTAPLANVMLLKNRHAVLIHNLPGFNPSLIRSTGSFISTNIGDLVLEQREVRLK